MGVVQLGLSSNVPQWLAFEPVSAQRLVEGYLSGLIVALSLC